MENARRECGKIIGRSIFVRRPDGPGAATVYPEKARSEYICSEVADIRKPAISASDADATERGRCPARKGRSNGIDVGRELIRCLVDVVHEEQLRLASCQQLSTVGATS